MEGLHAKLNCNHVMSCIHAYACISSISKQGNIGSRLELPDVDSRKGQEDFLFLKKFFRKIRKKARSKNLFLDYMA